VRFDYLDDTRAALGRVLGDTIEFEDQITQACKGYDVSEVAVHPIAPGLSGAAVFLIRRIGAREGFTPWIAKTCSAPALIIEERENNQKCVQGKLPAAPKLIPTGSSRLLLFEFGGALAGYNPRSLRSGYALSSADALATLMRRIVTSLKAIDQLSEDTTSCVHRMPLVKTLEKQLQDLKSPLPSDVIARLCDSWHKAIMAKDQFPRIRSTAHGDLNSENVLFEPGNAASLPVFIDFASMRRSKDNLAYPDFYHLPFWDYAKLERDIHTRLFLKEAINGRLDKCTIIGAIRAINGAAVGTAQTASEPIAKLVKTTSALRESIQNEFAPADFKAYRAVLAYAMLTVLFREQPDAEAQDLQYLVAAESGITLLADPLSALPSISVDPPALKVGDEPSAETPPLANSGIDPLGTAERGPNPNRGTRHIGIRWKIAIPLILALLIVAATAMVWHRYAGHRDSTSAISSKSDAASSHSAQTQSENRPARPPAPPLVSKSNPRVDGPAQPTWEDIRSQVQKEYSSTVELKKLGTFLCTEAPDLTIKVWNWPWQPYTGASNGTTCRQDVSVTEQGADASRNIFQVAVLYKRHKRQWEFWKLESRSMGSEPH